MTDTTKWLAIEKADCPKFISDNTGKEKLLEIFNAEVKRNLNNCTNQEKATRFFDAVNIPGTSAQDYLYRTIDTPFGQMLTAIRFIGGDHDKPAVFLIYKDFELNNSENIKQIGKIIKKSYAAFKPNRFRWFSPQIEAELISSHNFIAGDLVYLSGYIKAIKDLPLPQYYDRAHLELSGSLDWYPLYENGVKGLYEQNPAFVEMLEQTSRKTFQELTDKGLLFEIFVEEDWAGVIGVDRDHERFLSGFVVYEQFLIEKFRRKGLAAAIQRKLINRLPHSRNEMLYGTIHYDNQPSLRTALRVGRQVAGMYIFAEI